jgi:CubicO group peptidase (beta-lactamase class C family)
VTEQELRELLHEHAAADGVPGAALGLLQDGAEAHVWYGVADARTGVPIDADSRFSVGSLTKPMVATVVVRLAEEGRLSLDDPIARRVPELRGVAWAERATVRDLLANRSGLPLRSGLEFDFAARERDDDVLARLAARVAAEEPTTLDWSYTNVGWCLLGRAVENVAGTVWEDVMQSMLLGPAHMSRTAFGAGPRVAGHALTADGPVPVEPLTARTYGPAGTTAVSPVGDLLRFAALHLGDPALATLREAQPSPRIHGWFDGWCLGWACFNWDGGRVWGWDSVVSGERAFLRLFPEQHGAIVLMTNGENGRALYRSLFPELMRSHFELGVPPLQLDARPGVAGDLSRFAGVYAWPDRRIEVVATDSCLLTQGGTEALPLDACTFLVDRTDHDNPTITFGSFDATGRPRVLYAMLWGLPRE